MFPQNLILLMLIEKDLCLIVKGIIGTADIGRWVDGTCESIVITNEIRTSQDCWMTQLKENVAASVINRKWYEATLDFP